MKAAQPDLFQPPAGLPDGLVYRPDFLSQQEERELVGHVERLPFEAFEFHGFLGKRRTVSFGWRYVFDGSGLTEAESIPDFLLPLRERAAALAGREADAFPHVLVTEYANGAGIGWHRDRSVFGEVVGISLLSPAKLRFRRKDGSRWQRAVLQAEPRSAYLLSGPSRTEWEHSIAATEGLRYSITFRTLRS
jgi:alkylated DNA repair dioxygenase AlkB